MANHFRNHEPQRCLVLTFAACRERAYATMPELPEVETVRRGLEELIFANQTEPNWSIAELELLRPDLRYPISEDIPILVAGQKLTRVRRRAKYLLFDLSEGSLISHLGMSGSWRVRASVQDQQLHDHVVLRIRHDIAKERLELVFNDPRRFGMLDYVARADELKHPRLQHLGPEPLDERAFNGPLLFELSRGRKTSIKVLLMNQEIVVGVGNIYASEALFIAGVRPSRLSARVTRTEAELIVKAIREVLKAAIEAGGSSIRDYRQASGDRGGFQNAHRVYGRAGLACFVCGEVIRSSVIANRSTFWCARCQR